MAPDLQPTLMPPGPSPAKAGPANPGNAAYQMARAHQEFFIPFWSQVRLTTSEVRIINHPAFARLADINQLGQTHLVFRGATHRRWEHALGTMYVAQLMATALERNYDKTSATGGLTTTGIWRLGLPLRPQELAFVRLAALLHDIGHIAAGHTFEDELGLLDKHDADERLEHVLDRRQWRGVDEPKTLRELVDDEYANAAAATALDLSPSGIFLEIVSKTRADGCLSSPSSQFRMQVCRDLVGNTICADLLDYLHRDWYHLGKPRIFDGRLLDYLEIRENTGVANDARVVVNLRGGAEVRLDAVTAIFELLESRYQLGEIALFHRTKLTASAMLERLVAEIADAAKSRDWLAEQIDRLLECSDEEMLGLLVALGQDRCEALDSAHSADLREVLKLGRKLRYRQLHKQVVAFKSYELATSIDFVRRAYGGASGAAARLTTCRSLEDDFHLPRGSVVIYCPPKAPHAKIAQVQALVHERIDSLAELENDGADPAGTSGLLEAQLKRFDRLWRVQVSVSPEALAQLTKQGTRFNFERTVEALVLNAHRGSSDLKNIAYELARSLLANPYFETGSKELIPVGDTHARAAKRTEYPTGAPTLSSLLQEASPA